MMYSLQMTKKIKVKKNIAYTEINLEKLFGNIKYCIMYSEINFIPWSSNSISRNLPKKIITDAQLLKKSGGEKVCLYDVDYHATFMWEP